MLAAMNHRASAAMLGEVQSWKQDGNAVTLVCGKPSVRIQFWAYDGKSRILRASFPNTGREKKLNVQR